jgi:hypothetical protein
MVTILHLKDSVCPGMSHIVYQFVISNMGQVCPLQVSITYTFDMFASPALVAILDQLQLVPSGGDSALLPPPKGPARNEHFLS